MNNAGLTGYVRKTKLAKLFFAGKDADPFAGWGIGCACEVCPQTFDGKTALRQFLRHGFRSVILKPISVDGYLPVCFNERVLIKPDGWLGEIEARL